MISNWKIFLISACAALLAGLLYWRFYEEPRESSDPDRFEVVLTALKENLPDRVDLGSSLTLDGFRVERGAILSFTEITADLINDSTRILKASDVTLRLLSGDETVYVRHQWPRSLPEPIAPGEKRRLGFLVDNPWDFDRLEMKGDGFEWEDVSRSRE